MITLLPKQSPQLHTEVTQKNLTAIANRDSGRQRLATILSGLYDKYGVDTSLEIPNSNKRQYTLCEEDHEFYNDLVSKIDNLSEVDSHAIIQLFKKIAGQYSIAEAEQRDNGKASAIQNISIQVEESIPQINEELDHEFATNPNLINLHSEYQEAEREKLFKQKYQERFDTLFEEYAVKQISSRAKAEVTNRIRTDADLAGIPLDDTDPRYQELYQEHYDDLYADYKDNGNLPGAHDLSPEDPRDGYNPKHGRPRVNHKHGFYYNGRNLSDKVADSTMDMIEASQLMEDNHFGAVFRRTILHPLDQMAQSMSAGYKKARLEGGFKTPGWLKPLKYLLVNPATKKVGNLLINVVQRVDKTFDKIGLGPLSLFKRSYNLISHLWPDTANNVVMEKVNENRGDLTKFQRYLINEGADINTEMLNINMPGREVLMGMLEFNGMLNYSKQHLTVVDNDPNMKEFLMQHFQSAVDINEGDPTKDNVEFKKETYLRFKRRQMRDSALSKARNAPAQGKSVFMAYNLVDSLEWPGPIKMDYHSQHILMSSTPANEKETAEYQAQQAGFPGDIGTMGAWINAQWRYDAYLTFDLNQRLNPVQDYAMDANDYTNAHYRALDRRYKVLRKNIQTMDNTSENLEKAIGSGYMNKTINHTAGDVRDGFASIAPWLKIGSRASDAYINDQVGLKFIHRPLLNIEGIGKEYIKNPEIAGELESQFKILTTFIRSYHAQFAHQDKLNVSKELQEKITEIDGFGKYLPKKAKLSWGDVVEGVGNYIYNRHREFTRSIQSLHEEANLGPTDEHILTRSEWADKNGAFIREEAQPFAKKVLKDGTEILEWQEFTGYMMVMDEDGYFVHTKEHERDDPNLPYERAVSYAVLGKEDVKEYRKRVIKGIDTFDTDRPNHALRKYFWDVYKKEHEASNSTTAFDESIFKQKLLDFKRNPDRINPLTSKLLNPTVPGRVGKEIYDKVVFGHGDKEALEALHHEGYYLAFDFTGDMKGSDLGGKSYPLYDFVRDKYGNIPIVHGLIDSKKMQAMYKAFRANAKRMHADIVKKRMSAITSLSSATNNCKIPINKAAAGLHATKAKDIQQRGRANYFQVVSPQPRKVTTVEDPTTNTLINGRSLDTLFINSIFDKFSGFKIDRHTGSIPLYFRDRTSADSIYNNIVPMSRRRDTNFSEDVLVEKTSRNAELMHLEKDKNGNFTDYWQLAKLPNTSKPGLDGNFNVYVNAQKEQYNRNQLERRLHNSELVMADGGR